MESPLLQPLACWIASLDTAPWPARTASQLSAIALDWCGAAAAGIHHPSHGRYVAALAGAGQPVDGPGGCRVLGDARRWGAADAASLNAAISHFWEFDDAHRAATLHPGVTVVPVVLALAQALPGLPPRRLRAALIAGYEAGIRIGAYLGKHHYAVSHSTATAGSFGAAAAAASLLGLDARATLHALGHAGNQAAGLWQFLDDGASEAKFFSPAIAVRNGVQAAFLAQAGIPAASRILEGPRGMLAAWKLAPAPAAMLAPPAPDALAIFDITIKSWPTCGQMHSVLDATQSLARQHRWAADDIASVRVEVPSATLDIASRRQPATLTDAKFSTSFCVAALLAGHPLGFADMTDDTVRDPIARGLERRVELVHEPAFSARFPKERPARVTVRTRDGASHHAERSFRHGDPEDPWQWDELVERFGGIARMAGLADGTRDALVRASLAFGDAEASFDPRLPGLFPGDRPD